MASPRVGINFNRFKISKREALITSVVTFFSIFLAKMCDHYFGVDDYSLIFLTAVVYLASRFSMAVAVLAAAIFFISYDFFFFSVHDKFHRTLILSGFCLLKIAKISLNSSFFPKPIKR